jgi:LytS/YehU family sensor histidine kinase
LSWKPVRFEERLHVVRDIAPNVMEVAIPPMVVQTLVENAIKYGVSRDPQPSDVSITARLDGDALEVKIGNTGTITRSTTAPASASAMRPIASIASGAKRHRCASQKIGPGTSPPTLRIPR